MQVIMELKLPATVKLKRGQYISLCPILEVCSQGETKTKALKNLREAVSLFLISCFERGTLDKVLRDCGFVATKMENTKTKPFPGKYESIKIPLPFIIQKRNSGQCHV